MGRNAAPRCFGRAAHRLVLIKHAPTHAHLAAGDQQPATRGRAIAPQCAVAQLDRAVIHLHRAALQVLEHDVVQHRRAAGHKQAAWLRCTLLQPAPPS